MSDLSTKADQRPRRGRRRAGVRLLSVLGLLATLATGGAAYMAGRPVIAPDWVQQRIETRIARVWRKVKVPGHVEEVLEAVRAL